MFFVVALGGCHQTGEMLFEDETSMKIRLLFILLLLPIVAFSQERYRTRRDALRCKNDIYVVRHSDRVSASFNLLPVKDSVIYLMNTQNRILTWDMLQNGRLVHGYLDYAKEADRLALAREVFKSLDLYAFPIMQDAENTSRGILWVIFALNENGKVLEVVFSFKDCASWRAVPIEVFNLVENRIRNKIGTNKRWIPYFEKRAAQIAEDNEVAFGIDYVNVEREIYQELLDNSPQVRKSKERKKWYRKWFKS